MAAKNMDLVNVSDLLVGQIGIAYSYNDSITWVHPEYRDGKNRKK